MKRTYVDMHLCINIEDKAKVVQVLGKATELGYGKTAIPLPPYIAEKEICDLESLCQKLRIDIVKRVNIKPKTPKELTQEVRRLRRRFEVIGVFCTSKHVARQAAKDRRVDLLNFPSLNYRKRYFDKAEAELANQNLAALEINIRPLLLLKGPSRIRLLSRLQKETTIAQELHVPIVISSGVSDAMLMRKPREMATLASLFGLSEEAALETVSGNPLKIIVRNREKLSPKFVAPGIQTVREGDDLEKN